MRICPGGVVVSVSDYHPRDPGFDTRLYPIYFSGNIGSGRGPPSLARTTASLSDRAYYK